MLTRAPLRVAIPELFYDQLDQPTTPEILVAMLGLVNILHIKDEWAKHYEPGWHEISSALISQA